jgi:hypothetical protein
MARLRLIAGTTLAASLLAHGAAAEEDRSPPTLPGPRRELVTPRLPPEPVDYDHGNPNRTTIDYFRAVANVGLINWTIWQFSWFRKADWPPVDRRSLENNLEHGFSFDQDELQTNFLGHPYHGGLFFNSARGAGLDFWESLPYAVGGSMIWELFAEREPPSSNDLAATALGGIILGEISFRLSTALLDDSQHGTPRLLRELGAFAVNPMRGFNRFYTAEAWRRGPPPILRPLDLLFNVGIDRVWVEDHELSDVYDPSLLLAASAEYGDLLPDGAHDTLGPFDYFDVYASINLLDSTVSGVKVYAEALLYGFSVETSDDRGSRRDNNVFGFDITYDYQGANIATYGSVGFGPANYLVFRFGPRRRLRVGTGFDVVPVLGARSVLRKDDLRTYNFATGLSAWTNIALDFNRVALGFRTRQYLTRVVDGDPGNEIIGSSRAWFEASIFRGIGAGFAPSVVNWRGLYAEGPKVSGYQLELSSYLIGRY